MAFKTGDDSAEHIWIRGVSGNLVEVSRWAPDPRVSWAFSYPDESWRFGQPKFEHTGTFLLFWEALHKADRLLAYDLSTGISREILRAPTPSAESRLGVSFYKDPLVVDGATVVLVRDNREDRPRIFDIVEGEPIPVDAVIDAPKDVFTGSNERLLHFRGAPLLIARGIVPIEKRDGRFTRSSILEGLTGIGGVNDSPSDDRLCAVDDWKPRRRCGHILGGPNPITVPIMPNAGECGLGDARTP